MTISSLGIGSGLDSESIITKLMSVENQPVAATQTKNSALGTKLSTWGQIQSAFSTLKDASASLASSTLWSQTAATSSDAAAVSVTTGSGAAEGSYSIQATQMAQAQYVASPTYASDQATLGGGTLKIELGAYRNDDPNATPPPPAVSFAAKAAATAEGISIAISSTDTLSTIRDKINAAGTGVTASVINDASGGRLVLRGSTGKENGFRVQVTPDLPEDPNSTAPQLSDLAYDGSDGVVNKGTRSQEATDAKATINGIEVSSATNTFTNVLDGLTLTMGHVTTTAVNVNVKNDTDAMTKAVNGFATAYNSLVSLIRSQTSYDAANKTAAPLQGDSSATGLLAQLRGLVSQPTPASATFSNFSQIGISTNVDGTMKVDSAKLSKAMGNLPQLKAFFNTVNSTDPTQNGMGERFRLLADQVTGTDGTITARTTGIQGTIKRNNDRISDLQNHSTLVEARLRAQYQALDQAMNKLTGLSSYVTQQLTAMANNKA